MQGLSDLLKPERLTAIVDVIGTAELNGSPPYQRMLDEGVCTAVTVARDADPDGPIDLLKITGESPTIPLLGLGADKVAVHTATSFFPDYTFGDIDAELRRQGFVAHCFADCYLTSIGTEIKIPHPDPHQLAMADLFYVRDFRKPMLPEQWKHLALIAHHICGSYDLAMHAVCVLARQDEIANDAGNTYQHILERQ